MPDSAVRARVSVRGHVQGVFFRSELQRRAASLGVAGWVRNVPDGTVEAVFEGPTDRVGSLVRWCERGPRGARVDGVDVEWDDPHGEPSFEIRH